MGLDFKITYKVSERGAAMPHWSYSGFHRFRKELAVLVGIEDLEKMRGFVAGGVGAEFPDPAVEPLTYLLEHSDCDGTLNAEQCAAVAPRLRSLLGGIKDGYDREMAERLAAAMERVAELKDNAGELVFC